MLRIASTAELQSELRSLLEYSRSHRPSRLRLARQLLALSERVSMEFDSPAALKKYLKEHPDADRSSHTVKKQKSDEADSGKSPADDPKFQQYLQRTPLAANKAVSKLHRLQKSLERAESYRHGDPDRAKTVKQEIHKAHRELIGEAEAMLKKVKSVWDAAPESTDELAKRVRTRNEHIFKLMGDHIESAKERTDRDYTPHVIESAERLASFMANAASSLMRFSDKF